MVLESISNDEIRKFWFTNVEDFFLGKVTSFDEVSIYIFVLYDEEKKYTNENKRLNRKAYNTRNELATEIDILLYL